MSRNTVDLPVARPLTDFHQFPMRIGVSLAALLPCPRVNVLSDK